jgi:hypothetical protein
MSDGTGSSSSIEQLKNINVSGYGSRPIPCGLDNEISALVDEFISTSAQQRIELASSCTDNVRFALLAFAGRMASLAVRDGSRQALARALTALTIEGWRSDARENLLVVAIIYDAAVRISVSPAGLFLEAAAIAPKPIADELRAFLGRPGEDQKIEAMGYKTEGTGSDFKYVRTW